MDDTLHAEIERLRALAKAQAEQIEKLTALVEELRRKQHRPHAPFAKPLKPDPKPPGRKSGDDYGTKAFRSVPPRIDEILTAPLPENCPACGGGVEFLKTAEQFQTEIPKIEPVYRKFNVAIGRCACCRKRIQGRHELQTSDALGAAKSQMGSNAQALVTRLNKHYGLSHGKAVGLLSELCRTTLSRGASAQIMLRAAQRCGSAYKEIQIAVRQSSCCVPDETGWRVGGKLQWMHVFVTPQATLYLIRNSRGFDVASEALGEKYSGKITCDGWRTYERFTQATLQTCNGHLLRRCDHLLEILTPGAGRFPRAVKALLFEGLATRDARDAGEIPLELAQAEAVRLEGDLHEIGRCTKINPDNERFAKFLHRHQGEVFAYLKQTGLDATNWRAEQAIRPAVVNRKVWGGSRTPNGADAQGILMSVLRTAEQLGNDALNFLEQTLRAPPGQSPRLIAAKT
jgi:transposase